MLARRSLPAEYRAWNHRWGAPFGRAAGLRELAPDPLRKVTTRFPRIGGPFAVQSNNDTREVEYPWAFHATPVTNGISVVEIGGGLSGFQFVLAKSGARVINVDPGEKATGVGFYCTPASIARLNRAFRTDVQLVNTTLDQAGLADESIDTIYSISTIEHIPESELPRRRGPDAADPATGWPRRADHRPVPRPRPVHGSRPEPLRVEHRRQAPGRPSRLRARRRRRSRALRVPRFPPPSGCSSSSPSCTTAPATPPARSSSCWRSPPSGRPGGRRPLRPVREGHTEGEPTGRSSCGSPLRARAPGRPARRAGERKPPSPPQR